MSKYRVRMLLFGDTIGSAPSWRWDRSRRYYEAEHNGHTVRVHFHKLGGRWSRTLPDGKANPNPPRSYWTFDIDGDHPRHMQFASADEAKIAAVTEYRRRFGGES